MIQIHIWITQYIPNCFFNFRFYCFLVHLTFFNLWMSFGWNTWLFLPLTIIRGNVKSIGGIVSSWSISRTSRTWIGWLSTSLQLCNIFLRTILIYDISRIIFRFIEISVLITVAIPKSAILERCIDITEFIKLRRYRINVPIYVYIWSRVVSLFNITK